MYRFLVCMRELSNQVRLLVELGLTVGEAKVFSALARNGPASVKELSKGLGFACEKAYRFIFRLYEKGLVEVIVHSPEVFRAVSEEAAFGVLIGHRRAETWLLAFKIQETVCALQKNADFSVEEDVKAVILPPGAIQHVRVTDEIKRCEVSADFVMPWEGFLKWCRLFAQDEARLCQSRGVTLRVVTGQNCFKDSLITCLPPVDPDWGIEVWFLPYNPVVGLALFDFKRVCFSTFPNKKVLDAPVLWSTDSYLTETAVDYFEYLLATSKKMF